MYYTYIAKEEKKKRYYVGHTCNLESQLRKYNEQKSGVKAHPSVYIVHYEAFSTETEATKREREIKRLKSRITEQFSVES